MDFSQLLAERTETIMAHWVEAVRRDRQIESDDNLSYTAVQDHLPQVLAAMVTVLSRLQESNVQAVVQASLEHGVIRSEQGFEPTEIAREYRLLRQVLFSNLEADLVQETPAEAIRILQLVNDVVDEAIAQCFKSYMEIRLQELKQVQGQLMLTNQQSNRLVQSSQENFSQLAHELKTPLTSIIGYSDLFLRQQQSSTTQNAVSSLEHIDRVLRNGRQLLRLVNDALELSRYDAGKVKLRLMLIDVPRVLKQAVEVMEPMAHAKALQVLVTSDRAPAQVLTDPLRLQQIITNLVSNAIRYTKTGSIWLECQELKDNQWAIAVTDTGIGIDPKDQARVFEPYFRVDTSGQSSLSSSTGLGLTIVARLVKLLQGKIELTSHLGEGSTFTITMPVKVDVNKVNAEEVTVLEEASPDYPQALK